MQSLRSNAFSVAALGALARTAERPLQRDTLPTRSAPPKPRVQRGRRAKARPRRGRHGRRHGRHGRRGRHGRSARHGRHGRPRRTAGTLKVPSGRLRGDPNMAEFAIQGLLFCGVGRPGADGRTTPAAGHPADTVGAAKTARSTAQSTHRKAARTVARAAGTLKVPSGRLRVTKKMQSLRSSACSFAALGALAQTAERHLQRDTLPTRSAPPKPRVQRGRRAKARSRRGRHGRRHGRHGRRGRHGRSARHGRHGRPRPTAGTLKVPSGRLRVTQKWQSLRSRACSFAALGALARTAERPLQRDTLQTRSAPPKLRAQPRKVRTEDRRRARSRAPQGL